MKKSQFVWAKDKLIQIAKDNGADGVYFNSKNEDCYTYCTRCSSRNIYIDSSQTMSQQIIGLAHEVGHLIYINKAVVEAEDLLEVEKWAWRYAERLIKKEDISIGSKEFHETRKEGMGHHMVRRAWDRCKKEIQELEDRIDVEVELLRKPKFKIHTGKMYPSCKQCSTIGEDDLDKIF